MGIVVEQGDGPTAGGAADGTRLGFACHWDIPAAPTWSHTPWNLRAALRDHAEVVDLGVQLPGVVRTGLKALSLRPRRGTWTSSWRQSRGTDVVVGQVLRRAEAACDVVLQIQDLARLRRPYYIYQDLSYDLLLDMLDNPSVADQFSALRPRQIESRRARQHALYGDAAGVIAMSRWFATSLVEVTGLSSGRVTVVNPGATARPTDRELQRLLRRPVTTSGSRILFVGRDFHRKGGDLVVEAVVGLRSTYSPDIRLTIAGPRTWPMKGHPPDGVDFLGNLDVRAVNDLYASHDVLAMPSRFEAFGIAFAEALSWGMPCVAREAFAMPELIRDGDNGALVPENATTNDVADAIVSVVSNEELRRRTRAAAPSAREYFSWDRAAREVVQRILP